MPTKGQCRPWQDRFWEKIQKSDDCWIWTSGKDLDGYGLFQLESRRTVRAHRLMYQITEGPIPDGNVIMHSCDNPPCVNPGHLAAVHELVNIADRDTKGRTSQKSRHYAAKVSQEQVDQLRQRVFAGEKIYRIHSEYGISYSQAKSIAAGRTWKPTGLSGAAQDSLVKSRP